MCREQLADYASTARVAAKSNALAVAIFYTRPSTMSSVSTHPS